MRSFKNGTGALKKTYDFKLTLAKMQSKVYLSPRAIKIDNQTVRRLIISPKVMVNTLMINDRIVNLSEYFADLNGFQFPSDNKYFQDSCGIYAIKNKVNGKDLVELCLIKTFLKGCTASVSLYYIPHGDIRNICLVARFCKHFTVEHTNSNGLTIEKGETHLHQYSEDFFSRVYKEIGEGDLKKLTEKLQSPDALIFSDIKSPQELIDYAKEYFNITDKVVDAYSEIEQRKGYYIENGKNIVKGESNKTLADEIGREM